MTKITELFNEQEKDPFDEIIELADSFRPITETELKQWDQELQLEWASKHIPITLDHYQFMIEKFAVYPQMNTGDSAALSYCGRGLSGETGEVNEHLKKALRDDGGEISPERREALSKELGDVLWYLTRLAAELGLTMNDVAYANVQKLQDRLSRNVIHGSGDNR